MSSIEGVQSIVTWALVLITTVLVLAVGIWVVRRWVLTSPAKGNGAEGWSLQQLREMREGGQISETEFETLKAKMLTAVRRKDGTAETASLEGGREREPA